MALAFEQVLDDTHTTTTTTNLSLTIPSGGVPVGSRVVVIIQGRSDTATAPSSIVDSRSNTYNLDLNATNASPSPDIELRFYSAHITTELQAADTITVTYAATTNPWGIIGVELSGVAESSHVDDSQGGGGFSNTYNSGNIDTTVADTLLLGAAAVNTGTTTITNITAMASWTEDFEFFNNAGNGRTVFVQHRIVSSTGTYNSAPFRDSDNNGVIDAGSLDYAAGIVAYKISAGTVVSGVVAAGSASAPRPDVTLRDRPYADTAVG